MLKLKEQERIIKMKKVLLTLFGIIVVVGVLAGAGFAGYRFGYMQGATANVDGASLPALRDRGFGLPGMPMHNFGNNFERGFNNMPGHQDFGFMERGRGGGFGFFSPFRFIVQIAIVGLIIWLAYKLFTGNGWKLSLTRQTVETPKVETTATEKTE